MLNRPLVEEFEMSLLCPKWFFYGPTETTDSSYLVQVGTLQLPMLQFCSDASLTKSVCTARRGRQQSRKLGKKN